MHTSEKGVAALERHEGVVLKAYRDAVGVLTIGAGLTRASGVVDPKPGMTITREEASRLLAEALERNYEPAVAVEMGPGVQQHEFDAGVSFHFNTGAIARASWVDAWLLGEWDLAHAKLLLWVKGGGTVLPGLQRRREEEFTLLRFGVYHGAPPTTNDPRIAREVVPLDQAEVDAVRAGFASLGYDPGEGLAGVSVEAVRAFQADHDLTVDGIIGRATLSTLQRMLDARKKTATTAAVGGGAGTTAPIAAETAAAAGDFPAWAEWVAWAVVALALARLAWLAWSYRDALAARVQGVAPGLAARLRRI